MNSKRPQIVVVDDERYICGIIEESLAPEKYDVRAFVDPLQAIEYVSMNKVDLVLTDLVMGEHSGISVLDSTLQHQADATVIMMTAHPTVQIAISVLKKGAYDFLVKPFKLEVLKATIKRGLQHQRVLRENLQLKSQVEFLKVANSYGVGQPIDDYLNQVLNSCRAEFSAVATGMILIDPPGNESCRKLFCGDDERCQMELTDDTYLTKFAYTKSSQPSISVEKLPETDGGLIATTIAKPIFARRTLVGVITLRIVDRFGQVTPGKLDVLSILTNSASSALANHKLYHDLQRSYLEAINALAHAIEARDQCTSGHTDRVVKLAGLVATELGWDDQQRSHLAMGCTLHDIGKLGVPDSVLNKPGRLTDEERAVMETHPQVGLTIVKGIALLKPAIPYIIAHHERYDGRGYPRGLKAEDIPVEGRLLAVVDTFDAILSDRPYRKGAPLSRALSELEDHAGSQFDPLIVETFIGLVKSGQIDLKAFYPEQENLNLPDSIQTTAPVSG